MHLLNSIRYLTLSALVLLAMAGVSLAQSSNADLSNLTLSAGTLNPAFVSATTTYTASVEYGVVNLIVTPAAADALATITVNGDAVISGNPSGIIALNVGANVISI